MKKNIINIKRAVCIMANELRKAGYTLSMAFKKAWKRIKENMIIRAVGTTFGNRQERLHFLRQFKKEDLEITLEREINNPYDKNSIAVVVHILPIHKKTHIGYVPKGLASELAKVMDKGIKPAATLKNIIGGYDYKENYGMLLNITI